MSGMALYVSCIVSNTAREGSWVGDITTNKIVDNMEILT